MTLQYTGVHGANQDLVDLIAQSWGYVLPGGRIEGTSGARPGGRSSSQHYTGDAWDHRVFRADGTPVLWNDPEVIIAAEIAASLGLQGFGWGGTYMGGSHFHFDNGLNPHAPRNGVTVWSDDDGGASDSGPGAAQFGDRLRAAAGMSLADVLAMHELGAPDPLYGAPLGGRSAPARGPGNNLPSPPMNALASLPQQAPQNALEAIQAQRLQREDPINVLAFQNRPIDPRQILPLMVQS